MKRHIFSTLSVFILLFISFSATAQLTVTTNKNATQLAQKILGTGVTILNAQIKGGDSSSGFFKAAPGSFLIDSGIVLTTGVARSKPGVVGVNSPSSSQSASSTGSGSDADLSFQGDGAVTNDAC